LEYAINGIGRLLYNDFFNLTSKSAMVIFLNFILFPVVLWTISAQFLVPFSLSLGAGLILITTTLALYKYTSAFALNRWLKAITVGLLFVYAMLLFAQIGDSLLADSPIRNITVSMWSLLLSTLLIFALFIYYLLLAQADVKQTQTLDQQLNQILLRPSATLCLLVAFIMSILTLLSVQQLSAESSNLNWIAEKLLDRGIIPPITLLLFNWGVLLLLGKWLILLKEVSLAGNSLLASSEHKNSESFWQKVQLKSDDFYVLPAYINYALPILGFIGTVLGISLSAEGIASIIASPEGLSAANQNLGDAISPLGIAFDTTLIALSLGLILSLIFVLLQSWEARFLNRLKDRIDEPKI
jgi:hypothetical protein